MRAGCLQLWFNMTKTVAVVLESVDAGIESMFSVVWNNNREPSKFESSTHAAACLASTKVDTVRSDRFY